MLGALLVIFITIGGLLPAVPLSLGEAAEWRRALGGPILPLDAPPLGSWLMRVALFIGGDAMASLRISALVMAGVLLGCLGLRSHVALIAGLSAPLFWWLILSGLSTGVLLAAAAPFALLLERAAAPRPKREKVAPLAPWLWLGLSGALLLYAEPLLIAPMVALFGLLYWRGTAWRGPVLSLGTMALMMLPFGIWCAATGGAPLLGLIADRGSVAWWEIALAAIALGPFLLSGLRGATDALAVWIWSVIALALLLALLERGDPMLMAVLIAPLALRQADSTLRGPALIALSGIGAFTGWALMVVSLLYAGYGAGLPAVTDPHAARRADAAFCEDILLTLEEEGASAMIAAQRAPLLPCAWQGGLAEMPVIGLSVWDQPLPLRQMQGPLALDDYGVLVAFWPDDGAALAAEFAERIDLGERAVADHADSERRYSLWLVRNWTGR